MNGLNDFLIIIYLSSTLFGIPCLILLVNNMTYLTCKLILKTLYYSRRSTGSNRQELNGCGLVTRILLFSLPKLHPEGSETLSKLEKINLANGTLMTWSWQKSSTGITALPKNVQPAHSLLIIIDGGFKAGEGAFGGIIQLNGHALTAWTTWMGKIIHAQLKLQRQWLSFKAYYIYTGFIFTINCFGSGISPIKSPRWGQTQS